MRNTDTLIQLSRIIRRSTPYSDSVNKIRKYRTQSILLTSDLPHLDKGVMRPLSVLIIRSLPFQHFHNTPTLLRLTPRNACPKLQVHVIGARHTMISNPPRKSRGILHSRVMANGPSASPGDVWMLARAGDKEDRYTPESILFEGLRSGLIFSRSGPWDRSLGSGFGSRNQKLENS